MSVISFNGNRTQTRVYLSTNGHTEGLLVCATEMYDVNTYVDISSISGCDKEEIYRNAVTPQGSGSNAMMSIQVIKISNADSQISFVPAYVISAGVFLA